MVAMTRARAVLYKAAKAIQEKREYMRLLHEADVAAKAAEVFASADGVSRASATTAAQLPATPAPVVCGAGRKRSAPVCGQRGAEHSHVQRGFPAR